MRGSAAPSAPPRCSGEAMRDYVYPCVLHGPAQVPPGLLPVVRMYPLLRENSEFSLKLPLGGTVIGL